MAKAPTDIGMSEREALERVLEMAKNCTYMDLSSKRDVIWADAVDAVEDLICERGGNPNSCHWDGNTDKSNG